MAERISREERPGGMMLQPPLGMETQMQAVAGIDNSLSGVGEAQVSGGRVGIHGRVGATDIVVDGDYLSLDSAGHAFDDPISSGSTQKVSVEIQTPSSATVRVSTAQSQLVTDYGLERTPREINFEAYEVRWAQDYGDFGSSDFRAHYTEENNFYNTALITPVVLPNASRTLHLEGSFTTELSDRSTIQTGIRYRERDTFGFSSPTESLLADLPSERLEIYGRGGTQVAPAFLVEYGLYSTLRDGELSVVPRGGLVVHLGSKWRASTSFSHRIENDEIEDMPSDFFPVFFRESSQCEIGESYCYRASVSREWGDGESLVFGAAHREVAETQRLSFDEDFFNHEESLYLLPGDQLPEVQFAWTRRLSPTVLARVESTMASGGGGMLYTNDESFENEFQYMVTSVDAQFERSDTGVFLMFHQLQQELSPLAEGIDGTEVELEKLELMLTQDIGLLRNLASQLALQLNMEVSRSLGTVDLFAGEELRKRIMGGLAVKF